MGTGRAPTTIEYEIIQKNERKRHYREAIKRNKRINAEKKRQRNINELLKNK
mgnify:CR=1 FL=1